MEFERAAPPLSSDDDEKTEWGPGSEHATEFLPPGQEPSRLRARPLLLSEEPGSEPRPPPLEAVPDALRPAPLALEPSGSQPPLKLPPRTPGFVAIPGPASDPHGRSSITPSSVTPSGEEWTDEKLDRTSHALAGARLARAFAAHFGAWRSETEPRRRVEVKEPDERTQRGSQSRQSILLVGEARLPPLVIGWLDLQQRTAELRSFAFVGSQYRLRRKKKLELRQDEYQYLVDEIRRFLELNQISLTLLDAAGGDAGDETSRPIGPWVGMGLLLGALVAYLVFRLAS